MPDCKVVYLPLSQRDLIDRILYKKRDYAQLLGLQ